MKNRPTHSDPWERIQEPTLRIPASKVAPIDLAPLIGDERKVRYIGEVNGVPIEIVIDLDKLVAYKGRCVARGVRQTSSVAGGAVTYRGIN